MSMEPANLENAILGMLFIDDRSQPRVFGALEPRDFQDPRRRKMFEACQHLFQEGTTLEPPAVIHAMELRGAIDPGDAMVAVAEGAGFFGNCDHYLQAIRRETARRELQSLSRQWTERAEDPTTDPEELVDEFASAGEDYRARMAGDESISISDALKDSMRILEKRQAGESPYLTGWYDLDELCPIEPAALTVVAGRPGMGKTSMMMGIARQLADRGIPVLFVPLEAPHHETANGLAAAHANVSIKAIRSGKMSDADMKKYVMACAEIESMPITIFRQMEIERILAYAKGMRKNHEHMVVIVDYIQILTTTNASLARKSREQEVAYFARSLKQAAKKMDIPVIAGAQINRSASMEKDKKPRLHHLRESGAIENDADNVLLLFRGDYYQPDPPPEGTPSEVDVDIAKQRHGPTGKFKMIFRRERLRFESMASMFNQQRDPGEPDRDWHMD